MYLIQCCWGNLSQPQLWAELPLSGNLHRLRTVQTGFVQPKDTPQHLNQVHAQQTALSAPGLKAFESVG